MESYAPQSLRRRVGKMPLLGRGSLILYRAKRGDVVARSSWRFLVWLFSSKEYTNLTYDLTDRNKDHLACFVAQVANVSYEQARKHMRELEDDRELRDHIHERIRRSEEGKFADLEVRYGRRLGWYAFTRILKPRVVVETGVDKGLGACVLAAALKRNAAEGHPGFYYGTDINPRAGYLLQGAYADFGRILYGDSIQSLKGLTESIDLFVNDSDHSGEYEGREYETIKDKLSPRAVILGDNAHLTDELLRFAVRTERSFLYFREQPREHWYLGDGIGAAFRKGAS